MTTLLEAPAIPAHLIDSCNSKVWAIAWETAIKEALRQAAQDAEVYTPLTNAEHYQIWSAGGAYMPIDDWNLTVTWEDERVVERAVIERLGMRWPE